MAKGLDKTLEDSTVVDPSARRQRFGSTLHVRLYGQDYKTRLSQEGLSPTLTHPIRDGWCPAADRFAIISDEVVVVVKKCALAQVSGVA